MRYVQITMGVLLGLVVFAFLDYALPSKNTVRITNTYNRLTEIGSNGIFYAGSQTGTAENAAGQRDVRFIDTVRPNGKVMVYRNEDTGWIWPPYFKYDSSNLHSQATDLKTTSDTAKWVSITAYGWRIPWWSVYPNAISISRVSGPEAAPLNWPALVILGVLGLVLVLIWRMWNQFYERMIAPRRRMSDQRWDRADTRANAPQGRFRGWLHSWRGGRH